MGVWVCGSVVVKAWGRVCVYLGVCSLKFSFCLFFFVIISFISFLCFFFSKVPKVPTVPKVRFPNFSRATVFSFEFLVFSFSFFSF